MTISTPISIYWMTWKCSTMSRRIRKASEWMNTEIDRTGTMQRLNFMTGWMAAVLVVAAVVSSPCVAQRNDTDPPRQNQNRPQQSQNRRQPPGPGHAGDWLRRYKNVPPGDQERALQSDPAFRRLPPERQQMLRQRLQHFSGLPPQEQQRMLNRMETWEHLTPEQKQKARQIHSG